jgi:hypothetical protein
MKKPLDDLEFEDFINEEKHTMKDKIMNNSYNSGDIDFENFIQPMKIDDRVYDIYKDVLAEDIVEERTFKILDNKIYELFLNSPFYQKYKTPKRVDKSDLVKMYYFFKETLSKENTFTSVQIFMGFAEFFQVNYDQLYEEIGVLDKEGLLRELNEKYKIKNKIKTKKLF